MLKIVATLRLDTDDGLATAEAVREAVRKHLASKFTCPITVEVEAQPDGDSVLYVELRYHSLGRRAVRDQPKQPPQDVWCVVHRRTGRVFSWSYTKRDVAESAAQIFQDSWALNGDEEKDLDWNFVDRVDSTLISAR